MGQTYPLATAEPMGDIAYPFGRPLRPWSGRLGPIEPNCTGGKANMAKLKGTDYASLDKLLRGGITYRTIGNNTAAERLDNGTIRAQVHNHPIVDLGADGSIAFTLAGWPTVITRERVNQFLPADQGVYQDDWEQYWRRGAWGSEECHSVPLDSTDWYVAQEGADLGEVVE